MWSRQIRNFLYDRKTGREESAREAALQLRTHQLHVCGWVTPMAAPPPCPHLRHLLPAGIPRAPPASNAGHRVLPLPLGPCALLPSLALWCASRVWVCVCVSHSVVSDCLQPMNCSPPGSSAHGILQARILEWVAFPCPEDLPDPRVEPGFSALQADSLPSEPPVARLCRWGVFPYVAIRGHEAQGSAPARGKGVKDGGSHSPGTPVP